MINRKRILKINQKLIYGIDFNEWIEFVLQLICCNEYSVIRYDLIVDRKSRDTRLLVFYPHWTNASIITRTRTDVIVFILQADDVLR